MATLFPLTTSNQQAVLIGCRPRVLLRDFRKSYDSRHALPRVAPFGETRPPHQRVERPQARPATPLLPAHRAWPASLARGTRPMAFLQPPRELPARPLINSNPSSHPGAATAWRCWPRARKQHATPLATARFPPRHKLIESWSRLANGRSAFRCSPGGHCGRFSIIAERRSASLRNGKQDTTPGSHRLTRA